MHNKKQKLIVFLFLEKYINEGLFLPKIIKKLKQNVNQKVRNTINELVESTELDVDSNTVKIIALFYCLHIQKPRHGHMAMFTKYLIQETKIDFDVEKIKELNKLLKEKISELGLPPLEKTEKRFIQNVYYYKPDFIDKYPDLESKITPNF